MPTGAAVPWLHPEPGVSLGSWLAQAQGADLSRRPAAAPGSAPTRSGTAFEQGPFPSAAETFQRCQVPLHELQILMG